MKANKLVSIITVCYNAQETIEKTIVSVLSQKYRSIQYILIDGGSTDNTIKIIDSFRDKFINANIDIVVVSEEDTGIYNAMNKGVQKASGDWILFMNSDDYFYSEYAISSVASLLANKEIDIIYGDEYVWNKNGKGYINKRRDDISGINKTLPFCHQSSFVKKKWLLRHPFDENYKIVADYEFFLFCYSNNAVFKYCNSVIAAYFEDGTSRKMFVESIEESFAVKGKYGLIDCKRIDLRLKKELRKIYTAIQIWRGL